MSLIRTLRRLFLLIACIAAVTTLSAPPPARADDAGAPDDFQALVDEVIRYTSTDAQGRPVFDAAAAEADGASAEVLAAGRQMPAAAQMVPTASNPDQLRAADGIPVWGNWCGPGHGSGTPTDTLDTLCMRHDLCYRERGYFDCYCDAQLKAEINRYAYRMGGGERLMAVAVKAAFSVGLCIP